MKCRLNSKLNPTTPWHQHYWQIWGCASRPHLSSVAIKIYVNNAAFNINRQKLYLAAVTLEPWCLPDIRWATPEPEEVGGKNCSLKPPVISTSRLRLKTEIHVPRMLLELKQGVAEYNLYLKLYILVVCLVLIPTYFYSGSLKNRGKTPGTLRKMPQFLWCVIIQVWFLGKKGRFSTHTHTHAHAWGSLSWLFLCLISMYRNCSDHTHQL